MYFLYPSFLWALSALLIPIIIHLFRFRRYRTVYFTNVRFLKQVERTTASYSRIKHWLVLLARLLALTFLVLAFAQPYIPPEKGEVVSTQQTERVSIYVDNSFSMRATGKEGQLLKQAKSRARQVTETYSPATQYQLLTNNFLGERQHFVNKERFLSALEEVTVSNTPRKMSEVVVRQKQAFPEGAKGNTSYLISDFQKNVTDIEALARDTTMNVSLLPQQSNVRKNVYIDTCWLTIPILRTNHIMRLNVRVKNSGQEDVYNVRLALRENDQIKAITNFDIGAGEAVVDTLSYNIEKAGWHTGNLSLKDHPITFDNKYYISYGVVPHISVLCINQKQSSPYLNAIFQQDDYFQLTNQQVGQLDYSGLVNYQFIILHGVRTISSGLRAELNKFVERGGDLLVFPPVEADLASYRKLLNGFRADYLTELTDRERKVGEINTQSDVFKGVFEEIPRNVDLPNTQKSFLVTRKTRTQREHLLTARDGRPMVGEYAYESGRLYLSAIPLNSEVSNLVNHAIFVPMIYNMGLLSNDPKPLSYTIGKDRVIRMEKRLRGGEQLYKIHRQDFEIIPEQKTIGSQTLLMLHDQIQQAGVYDIKVEKSKKVIRQVAFNYDRQESSLDCYSVQELRDESVPYPHLNVLNTVDQTVSESIQARNKGQPLWKICVLLTLLFIAAEILLIRFWPEPQTAQTT